MNEAKDRTEFRRQVLSSLNASEEESRELLAYNENAFRSTGPQAFPLPDEPFVSDWQRYASECEEAGSILPLQAHLIQLRFPIEAGISQSAEYIAATRKGIDPGVRPDSSIGSLLFPERVALTIYATPAGRIPILTAENREDFATLVRALSRRNEPVPVSDSMGACIIGGYNNWSRVRDGMNRIGSGAPFADEADRVRAFQQVVADKSLYRDRFILLSSGPYSSVSAERMALPEDEWKSLSIAIRREHECAHYFTRRVYGSMRNNILDELIADYSGIVAAAGVFKADWMLKFLGLEDAQSYRAGARLENYRGTPPLSDRAFAILQSLVRRAVANLERFDGRNRRPLRGSEPMPSMLAVLSCLTLEELASEQAEALLAREHEAARGIGAAC